MIWLFIGVSVVCMIAFEFNCRKWDKRLNEVEKKYGRSL